MALFFTTPTNLQLVPPIFTVSSFRESFRRFAWNFAFLRHLRFSARLMMADDVFFAGTMFFLYIQLVIHVYDNVCMYIYYIILYIYIYVIWCVYLSIIIFTNESHEIHQVITCSKVWKDSFPQFRGCFFQQPWFFWYQWDDHLKYETSKFFHLGPPLGQFNTICRSRHGNFDRTMVDTFDHEGLFYAALLCALQGSWNRVVCLLKIKAAFKVHWQVFITLE